MFDKRRLSLLQLYIILKMFHLHIRFHCIVVESVQVKKVVGTSPGQCGYHVTIFLCSGEATVLYILFPIYIFFKVLTQN